MRRWKPLSLLAGQQERTAYGNGKAAGLQGVATNPHPSGTDLYYAWARGYDAGRRQARGRARGWR